MQHDSAGKRLGRPPYQSGIVKRVSFTAYVAPETLAEIKRRAKAERLSEGKTLDAVFAPQTAKEGGSK